MYCAYDRNFVGYEMTLKHIRETFNVPAKRGGRVRFNMWDGPCFGKIVGATKNTVIVKPDNWIKARREFYPHALEYLQSAITKEIK